MSSDLSSLQRLHSGLLRLEGAVMILLLLIMIGLAVTQILLRNLLGGGLLWGDSLVRVIVLWIGLGGAMCAARTGNHIRIDLLSRYLPEWLQYLSQAITQLFTALVCMLAAIASSHFVYDEYQAGFVAFAGVPVWLCELILPLAFMIIACRYALLAWLSLRHFRKTRP